MIQKLYVIHDRAANMYDTPVPSHNDATVLRWFYQSIQNVPMMQFSPQDFALYECGTMDTDTGLIDARDSLLFVATGLDCINIMQKDTGDNNENTQVGDDSPVQQSSEG